MCRVKFIWLRIAFFLAAVLVSAGFLWQSQKTTPPAAARKAVVVELFTSEGCSSCPPADELLGQLGKDSANGVAVIPLGFHVDYWNFQGWTDRFSSVAYSRRQEKYAEGFRISGPYTPQMVVDGSAEFVGSDGSRAREAIGRAAAVPAPATIDLGMAAPDKLQVSVQDSSSRSGDVMLAITEDNLSSTVKAGENDGRVLRHSAVVRDLRVIGSLNDGRFSAAVPLKLDRKWKLADLHAAVFVQQINGKIEGAASLPLNSLAASR